MSNENRDAKRQSLLRISVEYGNLAGKRLENWLDDLADRSPEAVERAVSAILADPERQHGPRIGELMAKCPADDGLAKHICWFDFGIGEPRDCGCSWDDVPGLRRQKIADYCLSGVRRREARDADRCMTQAERDWLLRVDPAVFDRHMPKQAALVEAPG